MRSVFASPITAVLLLAVAIALPAGAQSARPTATPSTGAVSASLYAVNAASLATAMTYCMKTHGPLRVGSRGETCFREARNLLARYGLRTYAERIDQACRDPSQFNTCITPEIGRLVMELNTHFDERRP